MRELSKKDPILVTGGLGFIGSHFIDFLLSKGHKVVNIDKVTYASNTHLNEVWEKEYPGQYKWIKEDVADIEKLPYCKAIVHFAAESHVDNSIRDGMLFTKNNVLGTQNILQLLVESNQINTSHAWNSAQPFILYISTDEVFGDILEGYFSEEDLFRPSNPYSASKAAAEHLVTSYGRTFNIPYLITRTTNNYGFRQHEEKLIPHAISKVKRGEKIQIHGSGNQVRNWIHVEDNCEAIYLVLSKGEFGQSYHIASDEEYSVNEVVKTIVEAAGKEVNDKTVENVQDRSGQDLRYALNCDKIKKLGWSCKKLFSEEIKNMIEGKNEKHPVIQSSHA